MSNENALLEWAEKNNVQPEDLDEITRDVASLMASNANNGGLCEQLRFLTVIAGWTTEEVKEVLSEVVLP